VLIFQSILLLLSIISSLYLYFYLKKSSRLYDDRFSMTIAIVSSSSTSYIIGLLLVSVFQTDVTLMMIISGVIGVIAGWLFGSYSKSQFVIAGSFNGMFSGLMGAMTGGVLLNPSLCGLPWNNVQIQQNIVLFSTFAVLIIFLTFYLLLYAFRA
jgi:uncharacterized membrane protein YeaQ/YmgE (transglycosylase-associated protein family)